MSLHGHILEVPPTVGRKRVELRYLEDQLPGGVEVWVDDDMVGQACAVDLTTNARRRRWRPKTGGNQSAEPPAIDPLDRARKTWKPDDEE